VFQRCRRQVIKRVGVSFFGETLTLGICRNRSVRFSYLVPVPYRYCRMLEQTQQQPLDNIKIKTFAELATIEHIDRIEYWSGYVRQLNKRNPHFAQLDEEGDYESGEYRCYVCDNAFNQHTDKFGNQAPYSVTFRYKPHKSNWRPEYVCTACFYALQNPKFRGFLNTAYSYPGICVLSKTRNLWWYKDLRDLSECDDEFQNPDW